MAKSQQKKTKKSPKPSHPHLRILVTNDDGIYAAGLKVALRIARSLSDDLWVVAPDSEQSGASHSLSLALPLRVRKHSPRRFSVQGTPTDCVLMAATQLIPDRRPDLVISGVNRGGNLADDITYSGTVAAAMEGAVLGIPSIALSQVGDVAAGRISWVTATRHGSDVVRRLLDAGWPDDVLININFPTRPKGEIEGVEITRQGKRDQSNAVIDARVDARATPYYWIGFKRVAMDPPQGSDLRAVYSGNISVTPLHLDLTHDGARRALKKSFDAPQSKK